MLEIDVHTFDYKLKGLYVKKHNLLYQQQIDLFTNELYPILNNNQAKYNLIHIINGTDVYNIENNMDARDILTDIIIHKSYKDILEIIEEQLCDMTLGLCTSGKCTRLFQIWTILY